AQPGPVSPDGPKPPDDVKQGEDGDKSKQDRKAETEEQDGKKPERKRGGKPREAEVVDDGSRDVLLLRQEADLLTNLRDKWEYPADEGGDTLAVALALKMAAKMEGIPCE